MARDDTVTDIRMERCFESFDRARSGLRIVPEKGSLLRMLADSGIEMVDCYRSDSAGFVASGDYVTAFAAINYSHAWIGCFTELGLFVSEPGEELFLSLDDADSEAGSKITDERMDRYLDVTSRARKKLRIASPPRSFDRRLAMLFLERSESYFAEAVGYRNDGDIIKAFASVNYSHAWLDCGARIGLFDVDEDDVLFTLFE